MTLDLSKGMSLNLTKDTGLSKVAVGVNWGKIKSGGFLGFGATTENVDLDASAILYDANGKHLTTVYYGKLSAMGVRHSGDDTSGDDSVDDKDNETITIDLGALDKTVAKISIVLVSFRGQNFFDIPYAGIKIYNASKNMEVMGVSNVSTDTKFSGKTSMIFGIIENKNGEWDYRAVNEPTPHKSLEALVNESKKYF